MSGVSNRLLTAQVLLLWDTVTRDCRVRPRREAARARAVWVDAGTGLRAAAPRAKKIAVGSVDGAKDSHFYGSRARRCLALDRSCRWREAARQTRSYTTGKMRHMCELDRGDGGESDGLHPFSILPGSLLFLGAHRRGRCSIELSLGSCNGQFKSLTGCQSFGVGEFGSICGHLFGTLPSPDVALGRGFRRGYRCCGAVVASAAGAALSRRLGLGHVHTLGLSLHT